jgi:hypothetical protein
MWLVTGICLIMLVATVYIGASASKPSIGKQPVQNQDQGITMSFVSGTEYKPGQAGQVIVEARYPNGESAIPFRGYILVTDGYQYQLYDDASVDRLGSVIPGYNLWTSGGCAGWSGGRYVVGTCTGGYTNPAGFMYRIPNTVPGMYVLGVRANITITQIYSGGDHCWAHAGIWISDVNTPVSATGPQYGVFLYVPTMTLYESYNWTNTVLDDVADLGNCHGYGTVENNLALYVYNGKVYVEKAGLVVMSKDLQNYVVSNQTMYGFIGQFFSDQYSSISNVRNIYDVVNGNVPVFYNSTKCNASVWYPDKSLFIDNQMMYFSSNQSGVSNGNAFIYFTVPTIEGVYEYQSTCAIDNKALVASKSFHVTKPRIYAVTPK